MARRKERAPDRSASRLALWKRLTGLLPTDLREPVGCPAERPEPFSLSGEQLGDDMKRKLHSLACRVNRTSRLNS